MKWRAYYYRKKEDADFGCGCKNSLVANEPMAVEPMANGSNPPKAKSSMIEESS